jgi:hypothetical protein
MRKTLLVSVLSLLVTASAALAQKADQKATRFVDVPALEGKKSDVKIQFVRYTGGTNGEMIVRVANRGKRIETFDPTGIYFVPDGDPEKAPQRLGAAGPFKVKKGDAVIAAETLSLKPGESHELYLQMFCIDSHRSSPAASNTFGIAAKRMPRKLRETIKRGARDAMAAEKSMPAAKGKIQSHVWKTRDADWIELQGERKVEKAPPTKHRRHNRRDLRNSPPQQRVGE